MEEYLDTVCNRKVAMKAGTYYQQTNPKASNIVLGDQEEKWDTTRGEHFKDSGTAQDETRKSIVRGALHDKVQSFDRKHSNLGHTMEFKTDDMKANPSYSTEDGDNLRIFSEPEQKDARYHGMYMPGAGDIRRMENVNKGRAKNGLPPLKAGYYKSV